jgi:hypothetical protein
MKISINGKLYIDQYEQIHSLVNQNSYSSIGDFLQDKLGNAIHHTEWFKHQPQNFDLVHNFSDVQSKCGDDAFCYMDSLNWSIMNKSELTTDIYKFITNQTAIMRNGFENNLIPNKHIEFSWFHLPEITQNILNMIDWHFVLDCISWFL